MPASCVVRDCEMKYAHSEDVSYHKFPLKKSDLLAKWIRFAGRGPDWMPTRWSAVCSRHFKHSDFKDCVYRKNLISTAVPSIRVKHHITINPFGGKTESDVTPIVEDAQNQEFHSEPPETDTDQEDLSGGEGEMNLTDMTCRLCGLVFSKWCLGLLVDYHQHSAMIGKCLPFVNLEAVHYPSRVCGSCVKIVKEFSSFYDNIIKAHGDLELKYSARNESCEQSSFQKPIEPPRLKIKQEPLINIKEEAVDAGIKIRDVMQESPENTLIIKNPNITNDKNKILLFNNQSGEGSKQTRESKNCEILEIVNLYPPIVDITSATIREVQPYEITLPSMTTNTTFQQQTTQLVNLKTEITAENEEDYDDYASYIQDLQSDMYTLEEHSYSKLPIEATDNKDEIFANLMVPNEPISFGESSTVRVIHVEPYPPADLQSHLPLEQQQDPIFLPLPEYPCQQCNRKFPSRLKLLRHRTLSCPARKTLPFSCVYCSKKFPTWVRLQVHHSLCAKKLAKRKHQAAQASQAKANRQANKTPKRLNCSLCDRTYSTQANLRRHESSHRPMDQWNHKCGICQKIFDKLYDLKSHFKLSKCVGPEEASIPIHVSEDLLYVCSTCNKQFKSYKSLKVHENIHTGAKVFVCETCGKGFGGKTNLVQHRLTHVDSRQFACKLCPKVFKRSGGLGQHVKSFHEKIRPYVCPVCGKDFALKGDMMRCRHSKLKDLEWQLEERTGYAVFNQQPCQQ